MLGPWSREEGMDTRSVLQWDSRRQAGQGWGRLGNVLSLCHKAPLWLPTAT